MSQDAPFDTYVARYHPGCPVGCVAVAIAQIMAYTRSTLTNYHYQTFELEEMAKAFSLFGCDGRFRNVLQNSIYTKSEAEDLFAKLLYYIGYDVHMNYSPTGSGTQSYYAYNLFEDLGFDIYEEDIRNYNDMQVAWSIMDGYLVYISGVDFLYGGHAWMIDGARWTPVTQENNNDVNPESRTDLESGPKMFISDIYVHCDWGWGGVGNGYYNGSVFSVQNFNFNILRFFSVKKEYGILSFV